MARVIQIYTDGACDPNPGPGAWAFVAFEGEAAIFSAAQPSPETTNNKMEIRAVLQAVRWAPAGATIQIFSDSQYVVKGCNAWRHSWRRNGWRRADGKPVLNEGLWRLLDAALSARIDSISIQWCRGHNGNARNEAADKLATRTRAGLQIEAAR